MNTGKYISRACSIFMFNKVKIVYIFICRVGIEHTTGETQNAYLSATATSKPKEEPIPEQREQASTLPIISGSDSGSDSN